MSNSVDPDETAHYELSHLDLCCLQKPVIIACGSERVKVRFRASKTGLNPTPTDRSKVVSLFYICSTSFLCVCCFICGVFCPYLFLIPPSFGALGWRCSVFEAFSGYLPLYIC